MTSLDLAKLNESIYQPGNSQWLDYTATDDVVVGRVVVDGVDVLVLRGSVTAEVCPPVG
jgi:hypothetical protein